MPVKISISIPPNVAGFDADALAYIAAMEAAGGSFTALQKQYINTVFVKMKQENIYTLFDAFYPFVGGTAATHKFNAKDPRDANAAYRLLFGGTVTHNANGITGNGTTGFALTSYFIPVSRQNNMHLSAYVRNNLNSGCAIGTKQTDNTRFTHIFPRTSDILTVRINAMGATQIASTDSRGFLVGNRSGASAEQLYKNAVSLATSTNASGTVPANQVAILARTLSGSSIDNFAAYNLAWASIGASLNASQQLAYYNIVQEFQTNWGRAI